MQNDSPQSKRILIVEADKAVVNILHLKFENEGFAVTVVDNGEEALGALKSAYFNLVLLDILLSLMDGFKTLEAMSADGLDVPTVVLSNLTEKKEINRAKKLGAVDYIIKSDTSLEEIVDRVKKHI